MLRWRLLSAGVIVTVLLTLATLDYRSAVAGLWLSPVLLLLTVMGTEEVLWLLATKGHRPVAWPIYVGNLLLVLMACLPIGVGLWPGLQPFASQLKEAFGTSGGPLLVLPLIVIAIFLAEMQRYERPGQAILRVAWGLLPVVYVGVLLGFWAALRFVHNSQWGITALLSVLVITKMADTGAYACGRLFGRHKMTPILSPGKTIEGAIGGILASILFGCLYLPHFQPEVSLLGAAVLSILGNIAGQTGDLAESALKRGADMKDSGTMLAGHGGWMDRLDSSLFSMPVVYWALITYSRFH